MFTMMDNRKKYNIHENIKELMRSNYGETYQGPQREKTVP